MFIRGANRMAEIDHPHIAHVLNAHIHEQGHDLCILEFIEGRSLHLELKNRDTNLLWKLVDSLLELGTDLSQIHARGLIHGDVSPKNIIIRFSDDTPCAHLVDFDLVSSADDKMITLAATGLPATDPFSAPEWRFENGGIDARADVFGLAMTLVYILYGAPLPTSLNEPGAMDPGDFIGRKLPFEGRICAVLTRACSHAREARHSSLTEFCNDFRQALCASSHSNLDAQQILKGQPFQIQRRRALAYSIVVALSLVATDIAVLPGVTSMEVPNQQQVVYPSLDSVKDKTISHEVADFLPLKLDGPRKKELGDDAVAAVMIGSVNAYKNKNYSNAALFLRMAYEIQPEPALLFNLARVNEAGMDLEGAVYYYLKFIADDSIKDTERGLAIARLEALRPSMEFGISRRDSDRDGVNDLRDKCPDKVETKNGYQDHDGCPDDIPDRGDQDGDGGASSADGHDSKSPT